MGDQEVVLEHAVLPHQQPARQALAQPPAAVGQRRLAALHHEDVDVAQQCRAERRASFTCDARRRWGCAAPSRRTVSPSRWSNDRRPARGRPRHAFISDHADLDALVGLRRADDRDEAAGEEIDVVDRIAGRFEDLARSSAITSRAGVTRSRSACDSTARRRLRVPLTGEFKTLLHLVGQEHMNS